MGVVGKRSARSATASRDDHLAVEPDCAAWYRVLPRRTRGIFASLNALKTCCYRRRGKAAACRATKSRDLSAAQGARAQSGYKTLRRRAADFGHRADPAHGRRSLLILDEPTDGLAPSSCNRSVPSFAASGARPYRAARGTELTFAAHVADRHYLGRTGTVVDEIEKTATASNRQRLEAHLGV